MVAPDGLCIRQAWLAADTVRRLPVPSVRKRHDRIGNGRTCPAASAVHIVSGNALSPGGRPLVPEYPGGAAAARGILPGHVEHDLQCHAPFLRVGMTPQTIRQDGFTAGLEPGRAALGHVRRQQQATGALVAGQGNAAAVPLGHAPAAGYPAPGQPISAGAPSGSSPAGGRSLTGMATGCADGVLAGVAGKPECKRPAHGRATGLRTTAGPRDQPSPASRRFSTASSSGVSRPTPCASCNLASR